MSSAASKAPTRKNKKSAARKRVTLSSNNKCEITQEDLNAVTNFRRYNLRNYSASRNIIQPSSKAEKLSNIDPKILMNKSTGKRKDKFTERVNSREVCSPKIDKVSYFSPKQLCKTEKNLNKSRIPIYTPPRKTEAENIGKKLVENSLCATGTKTPCKRILKGLPAIKSPMKYYPSAELSEKEIITERIYELNALRSKKVEFKTMCCNNSEVLSYEDIASENLKEKAMKRNGFHSSDLQRLNDILVGKLLSVSENENVKFNLSDTIFKSIEGNPNEKASESETKDSNILIGKDEKASFECKNPDSQIKKKYNSSDVKTSVSELKEKDCRKTSTHGKTQIGRILNQQENSDSKALNTGTNMTATKVENFRILGDEIIPETPVRNKTIQEEVEKVEKVLKIESCSEKVEIQRLKQANQCKNINSGNDILSTKESKSCDNEINTSKSTNEDMSHMMLMSVLTPKPLALNKGDPGSRRELLKKKYDDRVKILSAKYLKEIKEKTPKKSIKNGRKLNHNKWDFAQTSEKIDSHDETLIEATKFLTPDLKLRNVGEFETPQKISASEQNRNDELNRSNCKSLKTSKIPRHVHLVDNSLGVSNRSTETILDGMAEESENEKVKNCSYTLENKENRKLSETAVTSESINLFRDQEKINSLFEDESFSVDSPGISIRYNCDQHDDVSVFAGNENLPKPYEGYRNRKEDHDIKQDNIGVSSNGKIVSFIGHKRNACFAEIKKKMNQQLHCESKSMIRESDERSSMENDFVEGGYTSTKDVTGNYTRENALKIKCVQNRKRVIFRILSFLVIFIVCTLLFEISEEPVCAI